MWNQKKRLERTTGNCLPISPVPKQDLQHTKTFSHSFQILNSVFQYLIKHITSWFLVGILHGTNYSPSLYCSPKYLQICITYKLTWKKNYIFLMGTIFCTTCPYYSALNLLHFIHIFLEKSGQSDTFSMNLNEGDVEQKNYLLFLQIFLLIHWHDLMSSLIFYSKTYLVLACPGMSLIFSRYFLQIWDLITPHFVL